MLYYKLHMEIMILSKNYGFKMNVFETSRVFVKIDLNGLFAIQT